MRQMELLERGREGTPLRAQLRGSSGKETPGSLRRRLENEGARG